MGHLNSFLELGGREFGHWGYFKRRPQSPEGDLYEGPLNYSGECYWFVVIIRVKVVFRKTVVGD